MHNNNEEEYRKALSIFWRKNNYMYKWINREKTIIFFTGHGLIGYNHTPEHLFNIEKNNRYEWQNISRDINNYNKIFLRDLKQSWYLCGINKYADSVTKVYDLLKNIVGNTEIVTVGHSAGGFAAILFGCLLNAKHVIACSGQICLYTLFQNGIQPSYRYLQEYKDSNKNPLMNLENLIKKNFDTKIFYTTPAKSEEDNRQCNKFIKYKNVYVFRINTEIHGYHPSPKAMQLLLQADTQSIIDMHRHFDNRIVSEEDFEIISQISLTISNNFTKKRDSQNQQK